MNDLKSLKKELHPWIEIGITGHFPLFYNEWIKKSLGTQEKKINSKISTKHLKDLSQTVKNLSKHKTLSKKQTFIISLNDKDRETLIKAFFQMVESEVMNFDLKIQ